MKKMKRFTAYMMLTALLATPLFYSCDKEKEPETASGQVIPDEPEPEPEIVRDGTTPEKAWLLSDKEQLFGMREKLIAGQTVYFQLEADIDLEGTEWTPLNPDSPYDKYISFDGNGKTLRNLRCSCAQSSFFGILNGQVKNLAIDGAIIHPTNNTQDCGVLATLIGYEGAGNVSVDGVTIRNASVGGENFNGVCGVLAAKLRKSGTQVKNVTISGSSARSQNNYVGGLIGYVYETSSIRNCRVSGCSVSGKSAVGGLVGQLGATSTSITCKHCFIDNTTVTGSYRNVGGLTGLHYGALVSCCGVESTVTVTSTTSYHVGGISGYQQYNNLVNSYSRATVSGKSAVGVLVGESAEPSTLSCCYSAGTATSTEAGKAGGLIGVIGTGSTVSKCISWDSSLPLTSENKGTQSEDCYTKSASESGTVSSHARESARGWSEQVWDFSSSFPTLKDNAGPDDPDTPSTFVHLIPYPYSLTPGEGSFLVMGASVCFDSGFNGTGEDVVSAFATRLGTTVKSTSGSASAGAITFLKDSALGEEEYRLDITGDKVTVYASQRPGLFYAIQTLKQLLPTEVYTTAAVNAQWTLPCMRIEDKPRFVWRGLQLDVARHFFSVEEVKEYLDLMALYKLNRFQWHLTDDQGWRIEIDGDEALTRIGGYRESSPAYPGCSRDNGFFTKAQVAEIIRYAKDRCITVVPEIDMPGHIGAALAAHNELGCTGGPYEVWKKSGTNADVLCLGKESTWIFVEKIITQISEMFPDSEYIHLGGDEVLYDKVKWRDCPHCQALISSLGLTEISAEAQQAAGINTTATLSKEARLQHYFTKRVVEIAAAKGKKVIGWQEIIQKDEYDLVTDPYYISNHAYNLPGACVMSWTQRGPGMTAVKNGLQAIMTPSFSCYFCYGQLKGEPMTGKYVVSVKNCYDLNPREGLAEVYQPDVLGAEGCMWTEAVDSMTYLEYMLLPRLAALSEVCWTELSNKNLDRIKESLSAKHFGIYETMGCNYRSQIDF